MEWGLVQHCGCGWYRIVGARWYRIVGGTGLWVEVVQDCECRVGTGLLVSGTALWNGAEYSIVDWG